MAALQPLLLAAGQAVIVTSRLCECHTRADAREHQCDDHTCLEKGRHGSLQVAAFCCDVYIDIKPIMNKS